MARAGFTSVSTGRSTRPKVSRTGGSSGTTSSRTPSSRCAGTGARECGTRSLALPRGLGRQEAAAPEPARDPARYRADELLLVGLDVLTLDPDDVLGRPRGVEERVHVDAGDQRVIGAVDHEEMARRYACGIARGFERGQEEGEGAGEDGRPPRGERVTLSVLQRMGDQRGDVAATVEGNHGRRPRVDGAGDDYGGSAEARADQEDLVAPHVGARGEVVDLQADLGHEIEGRAAKARRGGEEVEPLPVAVMQLHRVVG